MTNELVIGLCVIIAIVALIANQLPSVGRMDTFNRRINDVVNNGPSALISRSNHTAKKQDTLQKLAMMTVNRLNLKNYLSTKDYKEKLFQAGYRNSTAETTFLFARFISPIAFSIITLFYMFGLNIVDWPIFGKIMVIIASAYVGIKVPEIFILNAMNKRREELSDSWPDALDLMVICIEAGMTPEVAIRRVAKEISMQSITLATELNFTLAELTTLPERTMAYENLAKRTNIDQIAQACTALIQGEEHGTQLGSALRVTAADSRNIRMQAAKTKAAKLGPTLTVPMILFFIPVLGAIIIMPGVINAMGLE